MKIIMRKYTGEADYWRIRNFLREVFLLNDRLEHSWHVARIDHWRWHFIMNCQLCDLPERVVTLWETSDGQLAAVLHPICHDEVRLHIHPRYRSIELEEQIFAYAEEHHSDWTGTGKRILYMPILNDDILRQEILSRRGFEKRSGWAHHWRRDLDAPLPELPLAEGYQIRSMGTEEEHPVRSWASWRAFHADEPDENFDTDVSWYRNIQSTPLYRRDLDIVAIAPQGEIASFCTISYDDYTRSAVCVLVGTASEHWRRGLGKAVIVEGMRRLKQLGCQRVFETATEEPSDALYRSVMQTCTVTDTWVKEWIPG